MPRSFPSRHSDARSIHSWPGTSWHRLARFVILAGVLLSIAPGVRPGKTLALQAADPDAGAEKPAPQNGTDDKAFTERVQPILKKYCFECHTGEKPKGGLPLDTVGTDFNTATVLTAWKDVEDHLTSRTMPPKGKPQPSAEELKPVLAWIDAGLVAADAALQKIEGRALLRRLNRTEYENTIRDLFGIETDVQHLFPDEELVDGFDNIGPALTISPILMERYLVAADAALDAVLLPEPKPKTATVRLSQTDKTLIKPKNPWRSALEKENAVVLYGSPPAQLTTFRPSAPGRYRVRLSVYATQYEGRPMTVRVYAADGDGRVNTDDRKAMGGYYSVASDESAVIEFVAPLGQRRNVIHIAPYGLGGAFIKDVAGYQGPGLALEWVEIEGPLVDDWPPASYKRLLGERDLKTAKTDDLDPILREFVPRAFRRPVPEAKLRPFLDLARSSLAAGDNFETALRLALKAVLCSPDFLFLKEAPGRLDDYALAARLSYFLWKSMPDRELINLAGQGKLHDPVELQRQVERLLGDPRAAALTQNFLGQWLELRQIDITTPDQMLYPEFDDFLRYSMLAETESFFEELLNNDLSLLSLIDSDFAILNERLARHYRIQNAEGNAPIVEGPDFRKVTLPPGTHRGGVLTQAAVLKVTANGTVSSPVLRGVWVLRNILGQPVPPPPPNVPVVEPDIRGATTVREQLAKHRQVESCAACHQKMDPPGFALENFDVIGGWRDNYRSLGKGEKLDLKVAGVPVTYRQGPKVEAGDVMPDGKAFQNIDEFKKILLANPDQIARCVSEKMIVYATGTAIRPGDRAAVVGIVENLRTKNYGLRALVHAVVQSELFLKK